jgi:hypothetical protein
MSRKASAFSAAIAVLALVLAASARGATLGLGFTAMTGGAIFPPDTNGAVGPAHIALLINGQYRVFAKSDGALLDESSLQNFWLDAGVAAPNAPFDPRIVYDAASQRWYASSANSKHQPNELLVAVSTSADPMQGWTGFAIDSDSTDLGWADFPMLGIDADAVFVAVPLFSLLDESIVLGVDILVIPKPDLVAAVPTLANATLFQNLPPGPLGVIPQPVIGQDGGGLPELLLSGDLADQGQVQLAAITGTATVPVVSALGAVTVDAYDPPPLAPQPGPKTDLATSFGDLRFTGSVVQRNGSLWAVHGVDDAGRAALRFLEIDAATHVVRQDLLLSDPSLALFFPSIAVNAAGDVVIGASGSSESNYAGAYALVGSTANGVTSFGAPIELRAGAAEYERLQNGELNRWGDYSATVVDPLDAQSFWTFQEYVHGENQWGIHVAEIRVPEPDGAALAAFFALAVARPRRPRSA